MLDVRCFFPFPLLIALLLALPASAQWTNVGVGIDYRQFTITMSDGKPNRLFVARMAVNNTNAIINAMIAQNKVAGAVETVPSQANRYEDAINFWGKSWGQRNDVVVAINGSFWDISGTPIITGGQTYDGWYAKRFTYGGQTGFVWKFDRSYFIADCIKIVVNQQTVTIGGGSRNYEGINTTRGNNQLIVYTPQYNNNTLTDNSGIEVLVELSSPLYMLDSPNGVNGTVRQVRNGQGATSIPFDHVVLSGVGTAATFLETRAQVGAAVKITADVDHYDLSAPSCTKAATTLANTYALTQGYFVFLRNGAIQPTSNSGMIIRNPRTFVAHNANYVFFAVCDGRSTQSAGMTSDEMGAFCRDHLAATDGVNQDGGGSSTMWVNGVVRNNPSDGNNRAVANGLMMVNLLPKQISTVFAGGQTVSVSGNTNLRLGPGTDYFAFTTVANNTQGTVVNHQINGVYAKGSFWWKCNFNGTVGWISQNSLVIPPSAPVITLQPANQVVAPGGTASFRVSSSGSTPFTYRWQKNGVNLSNGGHYSGVTTTNLVVSNADSNDVAGFRCVVTNAYGSVTSSVATLIVTTSVCTPGVLQNGDFEGATNANGVASGWIGYQRAPNPTTVWTIQADGVPPGGGLRYQQMANTSSTGGGGIRQNVTGCAPGATYEIAGWMRGNSALATCTVKVSPSASTDWATAIDLDPSQSYSGSTWTPFSGTVVATGTNMTIWLDGQTGGTGENKAQCFDSVTVTCVGAPVPPPAPTANAATSVTSNSFTANWSSASGATGYRLDVSTNNAFATFVAGYQDLNVSNVTSRSVNGLNPSTTYYYRARAYNNSGTSGSSGTISVTTASVGAAPPAPTAHAATSVTSTGFTANWSSASGATGYRLDVSTNAAFSSFVSGYQDLDVGNVLNRNVTGLSGSPTNYYRVRAYNGSGTSPDSQTVGVAMPVSLSDPCFGVANPGFEEGFVSAGGGSVGNHWIEWESAPGVTVGYAETAIQRSGGHSQRIRVWGAGAPAGGVYQRIPALPGRTITVNVWLYAGDTAAQCSVGVDPAGGTDPASPGIVWSAVSTNAAWTQRSVTASAAANFVTVFYKVSAPDSTARNGYFDDAAPPAVLTGPLQLNVQHAGNHLNLTWPACLDARLEYAPGLIPASNWTPVTNSPALLNGQKQLALPVMDGTGYFRLILQ